MKSKILVIGACGQIGSELTMKLREIYGNDAVVASDIVAGNADLMWSGSFEILDATDKGEVREIIEKYTIKEVYLMAAMLSGTAEKYPDKAWKLNMNSLFHVLDFAREGLIDKIFWPSSIAIFGRNTPQEHTPQHTITEPSTVYGISKLAGENWCNYYHQKYNVDVRSIRYPGIISYKTLPGGGTTDYAVEIFHKALSQGSYTCFLKEDTRLPMMYMNDAIRATINLMQSDKIKNFIAYNIAAINFTPQELATEIKKHLPNFEIGFEPDFRQAIADSWPHSIDDSEARKDWNWVPDYNLESMTKDMFLNLKS
ncbi:MAG: NAD-dependent epimerase/dehydratase family protein [Flavobacteriaceae bacterium]|nr:NAD-dependent epimerase/dehydratase family protein [Flavobacteriaceae bacterium]